MTMGPVESAAPLRPFPARSTPVVRVRRLAVRPDGPVVLLVLHGIDSDVSFLPLADARNEILLHVTLNLQMLQVRDGRHRTPT